MSKRSGSTRATGSMETLVPLRRGGFLPTTTVSDATGSRRVTAAKPSWSSNPGMTLTDFITLFPERGQFAVPTLREATVYHEKGASVNPSWVDWYMGFPPGWTALDEEAA